MLYDSFPDDIIKNIYSYIPFCERYMVNRLNHSIYYLIRYEHIMYRLRDSYIRYLLRNDLSILFEKILIRNYYTWNKKSKYNYKNKNYKNYLEFLKFYIYDNNSSKCMNVFKEQWLSKKQHKNTILPN